MKASNLFLVITCLPVALAEQKVLRRRTLNDPSQWSGDKPVANDLIEDIAVATTTDEKEEDIFYQPSLPLTPHKPNKKTQKDDGKEAKTTKGAADDDDYSFTKSKGSKSAKGDEDDYKSPKGDDDDYYKSSKVSKGDDDDYYSKSSKASKANDDDNYYSKSSKASKGDDDDTGDDDDDDDTGYDDYDDDDDDIVINECGLEITTEGASLVLEANLECGGDNDGISIQANDVTLNCHGNSFSYDGGNSGVDGIIVTLGAQNTVIKKCIAVNWPEDGMIVIDGASATIQDSESNNNGRWGLRVESGSSASVEDSSFWRNGDAGIFLAGEVDFDTVEACENGVDIENNGSVGHSRDVYCNEATDFGCDYDCDDL